MQVVGLLCVLFGAAYAATTVELLANDPNYSTLVGLVTKANLVSALNSGTFTIFAPTNAAFSKLPAATLSALGKDTTALTNVLTYHVVQGSVRKSDASNELTVTTLNGKKIRFNIYYFNNVITVQGAKVNVFDREASNGVIHFLDDVMMPPEGDIVDLVAKTSDYSTLLSLVQQAGIANALKGDGLTLFAPSNEAFSKLPSSIVSQITSDKVLLTEILQYHVVLHTEYSKGLYNKESVSTLNKNNDKILIGASPAGVNLNNDAMVVKADIGTTNGVVHEIDSVLVPDRYSSLVLGR